MARKASNIRRRGNSWVIYYRRDGRQHWRSFSDREHGSTAAAKDAAKLELARVEARRVHQHPEPTASRMTVAEHAAEWLEHKRGRVGEQTFVNYASVLNVHVLPTLGDVELRRVTRKLLDDFVSDWAAGGPDFVDRVAAAHTRERARALAERRPARTIRVGRSAKTISNAIVVLSAMFKDAVAWGRITASPASALERPRDDRPIDDRMRPLDADGLRELVDAADQGLARTLLLTAGMTGMRRGELLGLRWSDVDFTNGRVWVRRSVGFNGVVKAPKTAKSVRAVSLPAPLAAALEAWWKSAPHRGDTDYVFASSSGTPLDARNMIRTVFEPARRSAGIDRLRFHDLRHSYASILIAEGEHPKVISDQLGHASVQITMDRYAHLFDRAYANVSSSLERAWAASAASAPASTARSSGAAAFRSNAVEQAKTEENTTVTR
jgi:integrase